MKVLLKKFTVLAAAFAMLIAISACKDPNGAANPDKKGTEPATTTDTTTTTTTDTTTTTTTDTTTTDPSNNNGQNGGGQGTQTPVVVAEFEDLQGMPATILFYDDDSWEYSYSIFGQTEVMMGGTYTGNPAQDGAVVITITGIYSDTSSKLESCTPETKNLTIAEGIFEIEVEDENHTQTMYLIKKANVVASFATIDVTNNKLIEYKFYDNAIGRIYTNGNIYNVVTYDGDPKDDGDIEIEFKYGFDTDSGSMIALDDTETITIDNDSFEGMDNIRAYREFEVFKVTDPLNSDFGDCFKFYADGNILFTCLYDGVFEIPKKYGTYTMSNASEQGDGDLTITITHSIEAFANEWETKTEPEVYNIQIQKFKFTYDGAVFTRQ